MAYQAKIELLIVFTACAVLVSCANNGNRITSKDYSASQKLAIIKEKIELKSPIEWAEFVLYDANGDATSIPGASNKDYNILSPDQLVTIKGAGLLIFYNENSGYKYTLWVNQEQGEIIIRYIQD